MNRFRYNEAEPISITFEKIQKTVARLRCPSLLFLKCWLNYVISQLIDPKTTVVEGDWSLLSIRTFVAIVTLQIELSKNKFSGHDCGRVRWSCPHSMHSFLASSQLYLKSCSYEYCVLKWDFLITKNTAILKLIKITRSFLLLQYSSRTL